MNTEILEPTERNIARAADALRRGELVAMPTETVYGLAAVAFDEAAIAAVFAAKARPAFDPLIVHVATMPTIEALGAARVIDLNGLDSIARERAARLAAAFWPGPLTLVLPKHPAVPHLVTSGLSTVGVRMPRHPVAQALLASVATPLAAPSANRFGRISPTSAADVLAELSGRVSIVLDGGRCEIGVESSVVGVAGDGSLSLLRPGGIPHEHIEQAAAAPVEIAVAGEDAGPRTAPGRLVSHYAPAKPFRLLDHPAFALAGEDVALVRSLVPEGALAGLLVREGDASVAAVAFESATGRKSTALSLSPVADPVEAARNLFASLRALDGSPAVALFAEPWPDVDGLGYAIADRLRRAATCG